MSDLADLSCSAQAELIRTRAVSPVEIVRACLGRIEAFDGVLRAWITVRPEAALARAREAEAEIARGGYRGPLHGLPFGVKDQMHARGFPTTLGTRVLDETERVAPCTATVVERLEQAGAILLGKQNLHEFGKGGTIDFPFGQPRNPWHPAYSASSSSTGSGIATAAGMCSFSIGEDTGGSIRGPASCNGVVGLRPTHGRVSRHGGVMQAYTSDTFGPMTRSVADAAAVLQVIAGHDPRDPLSSARPVGTFGGQLRERLDGVRLGIVREIAKGPGLHPEVEAAFAAAVGVLRDLGAEIDEISLPWARHAVSLQLLTADADVASWFLGRYLRDRYARFDEGTRTRLAAAALIPASAYNRAMRARVLVRRQVLDALRQCDALICPTNVTPPKLIEAVQEKVSSAEEVGPRLMERRISLYPFSLSNVPAISVPGGFSRAGLPIGLQFAALPFQEERLLGIAHAYERRAGWSERRPDLAGALAAMKAVGR